MSEKNHHGPKIMLTVGKRLAVKVTNLSAQLHSFSKLPRKANCVMTNSSRAGSISCHNFTMCVRTNCAAPGSAGEGAPAMRPPGVERSYLHTSP